MGGADRRGRSAALGSAVFFLLAPGTVAGVLPWAITRWSTTDGVWPPVAAVLVAGALIGAGLVVLLDSFGRFVLQGSGTPTPLLPTDQLIVSGFYRHVRNPMYVAVVALICGQAMLFSSLWLFIYAATVWTIFQISVLFYEEPKLRADFGASFDVYCSEVGRWLPRARPWRGKEEPPRSVR